jgi:hypothetical protein
MKLFLDTEFNGFGGQLISLALVPENSDYPEFYKELEIHEAVHPWVKEHVIPSLITGLVPTTMEKFRKDLANYLNTISMSSGEELEIVADWPDDIRYMCESLISGPGTRYSMPNLTFRLDFNIDYVSEIPHNALHDAKGIRNYFEQHKNFKG